MTGAALCRRKRERGGGKRDGGRKRRNGGRGGMDEVKSGWSQAKEGARAMTALGGSLFLS